MLAAAQKGDLAGVKKALTNGADVNSKDNKTKTVFMHAFEKGFFLIAKTLILDRVSRKP